jgi:tRNA 2-thiocytidine biosynthesis protein TtcA
MSSKNNSPDKLHLHLRKRLEETLIQYKMLAQGDRVLIGVSGGADSLTLLTLLTGPLIFNPRPEFILAAYVDMGFDGGEGIQARQMEAFFQEKGYNYRIEKTNIGMLAHSDYNRKASPCFLCSRLRRRKLFEMARELRCNKVALAHNKDDMIETFLLNVFFAREISTMIPSQSYFQGEFNLIRPLAYVEESLLKRFAKEFGLPVLKNPCPTAETSKRKYIKDILKQMEQDNRNVKENIFKALKNVKVDYLLKK